MQIPPQSRTSRYWLPLLVLMLATGFMRPVWAAPTVRFEGAGQLPIDRLRAALSLDRYASEAGGTPGHLRLLVARGEAELSKALQALGYYRAEVAGRVEDPAAMSVVYRFELGEPMRVGASRIGLQGAGRGDSELLEQLANLELKTGDVFVHQQYESLKDRLLDRALAIGYLQAQFTTRRAEVDLDAYSATIELTLDTGPLFHFGDVDYQQEGFRTSFIARYIPFSPGDRYRAETVLQLKTALINSNYFARVEVISEPVADAPLVTTRIELEPRADHLFEAGLGYGTDTGVRTRLGWEWRRVNRRGHRFKAEAVISEIGHTISGRYALPLKQSASDQYVLNGAQEQEQTDTSFSRLNRIGLSRDFVLTDWLASIGSDFESEKSEVADDIQRTEIVTLGIRMQRSRGDDPVLPSKGERIFLRLHGASEEFGSDVGFIQGRFGYKRILSPGPEQRLIFRTDLGGTLIDNAEDLPASQRFFTGGDYTIRGYRYQSLGPENDAGDVIGGRYLAVASVEYELALTDSWAWAVFYDAGNAYDQLDTAELVEGAGLGLRWQVPFGAVRVDAARALDNPKNVWRLHLTVGLDL